MTDLQQALLSLREEDYAAFNRRLLPTVPQERILGVRMPALRRLAKQWQNTVQAEAFLHTLPHQWHEEDLLHAVWLSQIKDADTCYAAVEAFLPCIDNWAVCDCLTPAVFGADIPRLRRQCTRWLQDAHPYTVRFALRMLMTFCLEEHFAPADLQQAAAVTSEHYYVQMAAAWYFATALAFQYPAVLPLLQEHRLHKWVHNKTIQKAVESYRITPAQKEELRALRWK